VIEVHLVDENDFGRDFKWRKKFVAVRALGGIRVGLLEGFFK
jgi:hypothetical protein